MAQQETVKWYRWDDMPKENVTEMLDRRLITGDRMMLAHVYLKKRSNRSATRSRKRTANLYSRRRAAFLDWRRRIGNR